MSIERILDGAFKKPFEADLPGRTPLKGASEAQAVEDRGAKAGTGPGEVEAIASEVQIYLKRLNTELRFEVDSHSKDVISR
jgi:uncharacterized FlaG/YvyC family protein